jgi:YHS domain-containing protein
VKRFYVGALAVGGLMLALAGVAVRAEEKQATCPVSGKSFAVTDKTVTLTVNGQQQSFCCDGCPSAFAKAPAKYIKVNMTCPVMAGGKVNVSTAPRVAINDNLMLTCCAGCPDQIVKNPAKYLKEAKDPVTGAMFKIGADSPRSEYKGVHYLFANADNKKTFDASPDKYSNKLLTKA